MLEFSIEERDHRAGRTQLVQAQLCEGREAWVQRRRQERGRNRLRGMRAVEARGRDSEGVISVMAQNC
jgi:hypothetical protein